ncbi:MAG: type II toxin-antitoxin system death-on-curing family toxin [Deltaproteobacteria bacterium]|nr:type II toxin-antitoxin system death-on-curing family toxin [Deltaproteobacteria bacterium]
MILFPSLEEALELHHQLIHHFGGAKGVRDLGLLESALYRPQTGYYADIIEMAAALMESLVINHSFVDGNKRMAFFLTDIFLRVNGWKIKVKPKTGHQFMMALLKQKTLRYARIEKWLRKYVVSIKD